MVNPILTPEERKRFVEYLEFEISTNEALLIQMRQLGGYCPVIKKYEIETAAMCMVLGLMRSKETQTITGGGDGR